ncbi:hypothetical protein [Aquimarina pacifica]|uniref:hypothetical protein n=1 Tax=Aquimarina pacifica TaxID=1296415 RepID=UPI0005539520|nr:hypothetical protein [Aquimarina pacifica]
MKKLLSFICVLLLVPYAFGQITFDESYFIDQSGDKVNCLIKNIDWKNNPKEFTYKLSVNGEETIAGLDAVKEFEIVGDSKYIKTTVDIDRSSDKITKVSTLREPKFKKEQLFLKVLVQGQASLYSYADGDLIRYFYKTDTTPIKQLIFKRYKIDNDLIGSNNRYKQQLFNALSCKNITESEIKNLAYKKNSLIKIFVKYNVCQNTEMINFDRKQKRDLFNLSLRPGVNSSSFTAQYINSDFGVDFDTEISFRMGIEGEFILPFNKNKLALFIEPTYQHYESKKMNDENTIANIDYSSIEFPVGFRYYSFLNEQSKLFFNTAVVFDISLSKTFEVSNLERIGFTPSPNFLIGGGYKFKNIYSVELRYGFNRNLLNGYTRWKSNYSSLSLIFGYTLF